MGYPTSKYPADLAVKHYLETGHLPVGWTRMPTATLEALQATLDDSDEPWDLVTSELENRGETDDRVRQGLGYDNASEH